MASSRRPAIPARMQPMASSLTPQGLLARSMAMARSSSPRPRRTSAISMRRLVSLMEGSLFWSSRRQAWLRRSRARRRAGSRLRSMPSMWKSWAAG